MKRVSTNLLLFLSSFLLIGNLAAAETKPVKYKIVYHSSIFEYPFTIFTPDMVVSVDGKDAPMNILAVAAAKENGKLDVAREIPAKFADMGYITATPDQKAAFLTALNRIRITSESLEDQMIVLGKKLNREVAFYMVARTGPAKKK